jgi:hypothetical protein
MKKQILSTIVTLCLMFVLFPQSFVGIYANPIAAEKENRAEQNENTRFPAAISKSCKATSNPDAPCVVEVFSYSTEVMEAATSITQVLTCGVNVYTPAGLLVAKLWENVPTTWDQYGYSFSGATRGTWAATSYGWTNLTGPYPTSGSGNVYWTTISSSGTVTWLGAPYGNHNAQMQVWGNQSNPQWNCNGSY